MQKHVYPIHEPPHLENFDALKQICSDASTRVWCGPGIGKLLVFIAPLLDESTSNRAHYAQEEADKQHDIDANGGTLGAIRHGGALITAGEEHPVYLDDECCDDGREQSVLQGDRKRRNINAKSPMFAHHSPGKPLSQYCPSNYRQGSRHRSLPRTHTISSMWRTCRHI
jgi:hypothetical protein